MNWEGGVYSVAVLVGCALFSFDFYFDKESDFFIYLIVYKGAGAFHSASQSKGG